MSLVSDVKAFLVAQGQGANLFAGRLPDSPPSAAGLINYAGRTPLFVHNTPGVSIDRPALQVLVRDPVYATAEARAQAIYLLLAAVVNTDLDGHRYQRIEPLGSPFLLERDAKDMTVIAANFYCMRTP